MLEETIEKDLKTAMLRGDKLAISTLRGLKSVILYAKVASGSRESSMTNETLIGLLQKEVKKRQESADLFAKGGNQQKAQDELAEKAIIERYLPVQLTEQEIASLVDEVIVELGAKDASGMGSVIAKVRQQAGGAADGAAIARIVRERLG